MRLYPVANGQLDLVQFTREEVFCAVYPYNFRRMCGDAEGFFQLLYRGVLVACSADKELGLRAGSKEVILVIAAFCVSWQAQRDQSLHTRIAAAGAQPYGCSKGKSCKQYRKPELPLQPIERCADIVLLAASFIVFAFA